MYGPLAVAGFARIQAAFLTPSEVWRLRLPDYGPSPCVSFVETGAFGWAQNDFLARVGLALLHSLWVILLIAIVVSLVLRFGRVVNTFRSANSRYLFQCFGLLLMAVAPVVTFFVLAVSSPDKDVATMDRIEWPSGLESDFKARLFADTGFDPHLFDSRNGAESQGADQSVADLRLLNRGLNRAGQEEAVEGEGTSVRWKQVAFSIVAMAWLIGALLMLGVSALQWRRARGLCLHEKVKLPEPVLAAFERLVERLEINRCVDVWQSRLVDVPTLVGWLRPVILLPPAIVCGLSARELELILLHELIHVRRYDFAVNALQTVIESLLFFHPCVWWLSKKIRAEREFAADEQVVMLSNDRVCYAEALLQLEKARVEGVAVTGASPALAATDGSLLMRVRRIVANQDSRQIRVRSASEWFFHRPIPGNHSLALRACISAGLIVVLLTGATFIYSSLYFSTTDKNESNSKMPSRYSDDFTRMQRPVPAFSRGDRDVNEITPWQAPFGLASREIDYDDAWELWCAAADGKADVVKRLVEKDPRLKDIAFRYHCPLDLAVYGGHTECVKILLDAGTELTEKWGWYGWERMMNFADEMGHNEIRDLMRQRIEEKSNYHPDIQLMIQALCDQDLERMMQLIDEDPNRVHIADTDGNTALHWAVVSRQIPMIDLLVERGADPSRRNGAHAMPHQVKMWTKLEKEMIRGLEPIEHYRTARKRPLELGAEVDFHTAINNRDFDLVTKMLSNDPLLVHHMPGYLGSPLRNATPHIETMQLLLDHGADPTMCEHTAPFGCALYAAVCVNSYEAAKLLLEHGAEPMSYSDSSGDCLFATQWIKDEGDRKRMVELLNEYSGMEHIVIPVRNDKPEHEVAAKAVREVLARDSVTDWQVGHLLDVILLYRDADLLEEYIERFGNDAKSRIVEVDSRPYEGRLFDRLAELGAKVKPVSIEPRWMGATVLHWNKKNVSLVGEFVEAGGDINSVNLERQRTALSNAAERGDVEMVRELLKHGADPNLPLRYQPNQPLTLAKKHGHDKVIAILEKAVAEVAKTSGQPNSESPNSVESGYETLQNPSTTQTKTSWIMDCPTCENKEDQQKVCDHCEGQAIILAAAFETVNQSGDSISIKTEFKWRPVDKESQPIGAWNKVEPEHESLFAAGFNEAKGTSDHESDVQVSEHVGTTTRKHKAESPNSGESGYELEATPAGICEAARAGDVEAIEQILAQNPELLVVDNPHNWTKTVDGHDASGSYNKKPVEVAAFFNQPQAVAKLLEISHSSPTIENQPTGSYFNALRIALVMAHEDVVRAIEDDMLARVDAQPELLRDSGEKKDTLLFHAAQKGHMPLVRKLLERGANATPVSDIGHTVIQTVLDGSGDPERRAVAKLLIERGAPLTLWVATAMEDVDRVKALLADDPEIAKEKWKWSECYPLVRASRLGNRELVELLLEHGADVNADIGDENPRDFGMPLYLAGVCGHYEIAHLLLDHGASPKAHGNCVPPLVDRLSERMAGYDAGGVGSGAPAPPNEDAAEVKRLYDRLRSLGAEPFLHTLVRVRDHAEIERLLREEPEVPRWRYGSGPNLPTYEVLAQSSSWLGDLKTTELCFELQPQLHSAGLANEQIFSAIRSHNRDGSFAEYRGIIELNLKWLKESSKPIERAPFWNLATNFLENYRYGTNPDLPTMDDLLNLAELFVEYGADIDERDPASNHTALSQAVVEGHTEYVAFLLENGASTNETDPPETRPSTLAEQRGFREIMELLDAANGTSSVHSTGSSRNNPDPVPPEGGTTSPTLPVKQYSYEGVDLSDPVNQWQKAIETRDAAEVARLLKAHPEYANMQIMDRYRDGRLNTKGHHQEALDHVARTGHVEIARLLVEAGANEERIKGAFMLAHPNVAEYLLEHCDDPRPNLDLMAYIAKWESLEFWFKRGYKPEPYALHNASCGRPSTRHFGRIDDSKGDWKEHHRETVRVLLEAGADPNERHRAGNAKWDGAMPWRNNRETPLHHAASSHDIVLIQQLIDAGADKTLKNDLGETPFDWAIKFDAPEEVKNLLAVPNDIEDLSDYEAQVRKIVRSRQSLVQAKLKFIVDTHHEDRANTGPRHCELFLDGPRFRKNVLYEQATFNRTLVEIYTPEYGARKVDDDPIQRWDGKPEPKIDPDFRKFGLIAWFAGSADPFEEYLLPDGARNFTFERSEIHGQSCTVVKFEADSPKLTRPMVYEVWLSKELGYQPVRIRRVSETDKKYDFTIDSQYDVIDGIWFPVVTEFKYVLDGKLTHHQTMNIVSADFGRGSHGMFDLKKLDGFQMQPLEKPKRSVE